MSGHNALQETYRASHAKQDPGDAGVLVVDRSPCAFDLVSAGAETRSLSDPLRSGLMLLLNMKTDGGDITVTADSAFDEDGSTVMVFSDAGQFVLLTSVAVGSAFVWRAVRSEGVQGVSTPLNLLLSGAANSVGLLLGGGTNNNPNLSAVASTNFIDFRMANSATSGDNRGAYLRLALTGEGTGGGETLRALTNVGANLGTAHGAHISLSFAAEAGGSETSGLGAAVRGTTHIPNVASWAPTGTVYAGMLELYSDGSSSDPAGLTELAVLCLSNSGDATGKADVDTDAFVLSIQGFTAATGVTNAISNTSPSELDMTSSALGIRVKIGAGTYYIPAIPAADWN